MQRPARPPPVAAPTLLLLVTAIALGLARSAPAVEAETLAGTAAVIDGDTIRIGETVVRLFDVDAPELTQTCDRGPSRLLWIEQVAGTLPRRQASGPQHAPLADPPPPRSRRLDRGSGSRSRCGSSYDSPNLNTQ